MANVGYATLTIIPSAKDFARKLRREVSSDIKQVESSVGDVEVGVDVDRSAMDRVTSSIAEMGGESRSASRSVSKLGTSLAGATLHSKLLNFTIIAVGAAIPVAAASTGILAGAIGGLASIASVAAGGLGAFGLAAAGNVGKVTEVADEVEKLNERLRDTDDAEKRAEIIAERTRLLEKLTPAQRGLMRAINDAEQAWNRFLDATSRPVTNALTSWIGVVEPGLKAITPLVEEVAAAIKGLGTTMRLDIEGGFLGDFISFLEGKAGKVIRQFGGVFRNAFKGITGIIEAFWPLGQDILDWLVNASKRFARWGQTLDQNQQFQDFVRWVRENGPQLLDTLKAVGGLLVEVGRNLAPLGVQMLKGIEWFARFLTQLGETERNLRNFSGNIPGIINQIGGAWGLIKSTLVAPVRTARVLVAVQLNQLKINVLGNIRSLLGSIITALEPLPGNMEAPFRAAHGRVSQKMADINAESQRKLTGLNSTVQSKMQGIPPRFTRAWQKAHGETAGGLRRNTAAASSGAQDVVNSQNRVSTGVPRKHRQGWNSAQNATNAGAQGVVNTASSVPGRIVTAFAGLSPRMFSIGVSIMSGLQSGIQSMIGAVSSAAQSAASAVAGAARGALGIESPSKVFEDIGHNVAEGLAGGMRGSRRLVDSSARDLVSRAAAGGQVAAAGASGGGALAVRDGRLDISRDSQGRLEAWVRDITVQEIGDDNAFQKRRS